MQRLSADLRNALAATQVINHSLSRGEVREDVFAEQLRPYIPRRFELSSGEVANSAGSVSRQQDLIITDSLDAAPIFASGRIGIHPIESVRACIEIKSQPSATQIRDAVRCVASVNRLASNAPRRFSTLAPGGFGMGETSNKCFSGVVAYGGSGSTASLARAFLEENLMLDPLDRCDALLVVDGFVCLWIDSNGGMVFPENGERLGFAELGETSLLIFYLWLMHRLADFKPPPLDLLQYAQSVEALTGFHWQTL